MFCLTKKKVIPILRVKFDFGSKNWSQIKNLIGYSKLVTKEIFISILIDMCSFENPRLVERSCFLGGGEKFFLLEKKQVIAKCLCFVAPQSDFSVKI